jgi:hypothetical protein
MTELAGIQSAPWIQMASGRLWVLTDPTPDQVYWPDIAKSLAKICRFNGHSTLFYSVAQHCCLVADILPPRQRLYGLLHDAHEAVLGDITSPVKAALRSLGGPEGGLWAFDHLADITDHAVFKAAGLPAAMPKDVAAAIKHADLTLLATERRDLLAPCAEPWLPMPDPLPKRIKPWAWPKAMEEWLTRLDRHLPHGKRREGAAPGQGHQQLQRST